MKKRVVFFLVAIFLPTIIFTQTAKADSYEDEVRIYFEKGTTETLPITEDSQNRDVIKDVPKKEQLSKLPQLGQMITSIMVLLVGLIVILIVMMIYLVRKVNQLKKLGGL